MPELNVNFKRFMTQVKQAKQSGATELRIPIKMADDLVMELTLLLADRVSEYQEALKSAPKNNSIETIVNMDGGSFDL